MTFTFSPSICYAVMESDAVILVFFLIFSPKPALALPSFTLIRRLFSSSSLSGIGVVSSEVVDVSPTYLYVSL